MHLDFADAMKIAIPIILGLGCTQLLLHWQNRKDARIRDVQQQVIAREYPPHKHGELTKFAQPTDILTVKGLYFPQKNGNGK